MNTLKEEIAEIRQRLDVLEQRVKEPQEIPPVWFKPKASERYAFVRQSAYGKWVYDSKTEDGAYPCIHLVLHPYHAERYCEAMNTLALLRAEGDEVIEGKAQWCVDEDGCVLDVSDANAKYVWCGGIVKNSKEALYALLAKHSVTRETVAKMLRFVNGDKTTGDW